MERSTNWIDGAERQPRDGHWFEVSVPGSPEAVGQWPRSSAGDVETALEALARSAGAWAATPLERRLAMLGRASGDLAADPDPDGAIEATLGLVPTRLGRATAVPGPAAGEAGIVLVRRHWGELLAARVLFAELAAGNPVLLVGDGRVPALADRVLRALLAAGVPRDAVALVHDDGDTAVRAALASGRVARWRASGYPEARERCEALVEAATPQGLFGAGVVQTLGPALEFAPLVRGGARVAEGDEPARCAKDVARRAFGRIETMSGQLPGQVGVVEVHPRRLSRFTEVLLETLEGSFSRTPPAAFLDPDLVPHLRAMRDLGLDEGATLIHEGRPPESHADDSDATLIRLVFTNVEPHMRLVACSRPAPVLLLQRRELDGDSDDRREARA